MIYCDREDYYVSRNSIIKIRKGDKCIFITVNSHEFSYKKTFKTKILTNIYFNWLKIIL